MNWIWFLSKAGADDIHLHSNSTTLHTLRERASFVYWGPTFLSRLECGRFGLLVGGFGGGLLYVHDDWTDNGNLYKVRAKTYAAVANVGWDYSVYRLASFGINARVLLANMKEYTFNGEKVVIKQPDDPHYWINITMSRFELNAGIRFGL